MRTQTFLVYLSLYLTTCVSEKVTLKCSPSRSRNSELTCKCDIKIDTITSLPIIEVNCEYLQLEEFPNFNVQRGVNSLDLSHNNLKKLLKKDVNLELGETIFNLKFCHNNISYIDDDFFEILPHLNSLDLSHNSLTKLNSVFDNLNDLKVLNLSFNRIENVADGIFKNLKELKNIDLSYNPLQEILENPTAIMDVLGLNENLLHLSMNNVGVTRIHAKCWNNFKKLKYLSVSDNPISEIPQTAPTLEYLDISGTNISNLHENYLMYTNLTVLKMQRMENLTDVPRYALYNLVNLEEFILTDSYKIKQLNEYIFGPLGRNYYPRKLKKFDISRNRIQKLNETFKYIFQEMEQVDVGFNTWRCDCDLLWMKEFDFNMERKNEIRCGSPIDVINKKLLELQPKDIPDCFPAIFGKKSHQTAIVLLIIVIFALIVVIVYLCLYSPSWSIKLTKRTVSPDSPYSINNEQM